MFDTAHSNHSNLETKPLSLEAFKAAREALANPSNFAIVTCDYLTDTRSREVSRTWSERLFSWPWRPWVSKKTEYFQVPKEEIYVVDNKIVCHPTIALKLRKAFEEQWVG